MSPHRQTIVGWHTFQSGGEKPVSVCVCVLGGVVSNEGSKSSLTAYQVKRDQIAVARIFAIA